MVAVASGNYPYLSKCLVACNVYVSAGSRQYRDCLLKLLEDAQSHCQQSRAVPLSPPLIPSAASAAPTVLQSEQEEGIQKDHNGNRNKIAIVHAFADGPYDRSSFHIAGSPYLVSAVASRLATQAIEILSSTKINIQDQQLEYSSSSSSSSTESKTHNSVGNTPHPTVGLVDHVSILPLTQNTNNNNTNEPTEGNTIITLQEWCDYHRSNTLTTIMEDDAKSIKPTSATIPSGWVAREVGLAMESAGVDVFLYGNAHENNTPLATVRRESTNFFKSLPAKNSLGQATVGAPTYFVENYNIRLKPECTKKTALSLTKYLREKDGGLPYVEALTLPYSENRFEAACNLLNPNVTSVKDIESKVKEWINIHGDLVETGYRVGTTAEQCLRALEQTSTKSGEETYNREVRERLESYLTQ